ncbi:unnamed protein product, partial [Staurois parvus]
FHEIGLASFEFGLVAINCYAYKLLSCTTNAYRSSVKNSSKKSMLVCERPGCTRPLVLASSPKGRAALVLALCCI